LAYIQFLGAAGTVTGSKHLINTCADYNNKSCFQVLVDCGMFQGQKEWRERNWEDTPIPAHEIDAVILTHAHLDHSGWIPRLVKADDRSLRHSAARLRPPAGRRCELLQQAQPVEAPSGAAPLQLGGGARESEILQAGTVRRHQGSLSSTVVPLRPCGAHSGFVNGGSGA
jgi:glyoxylase-like metal-dependent hydrolase (beta-lactamase superfamily II)